MCSCLGFNFALLRNHAGEFPGDPVVNTWLFHSCGPGFDPWSGTKFPQAEWHGQKNKVKWNYLFNIEISGGKVNLNK